LQPHGPEPAKLLYPWDFAGKNTRVGCHFLLLGIFPTKGSNPLLPHWQADSLPLSHQGSPIEGMYLNIRSYMKSPQLTSYSAVKN